jgi:Flp pilus assembly protein TadD
MEVAVITSSSFRFMTIVVGLSLFGCAQVPDLVSHNEELRSQGQQQFVERNYADAAGTFRTAARQDPRDYKALYSLGACYEKMNQFHQAIEAYKSSLDSQTRTLAGQEDEQGRLRTMDSLASLIAKGDSRDAETNVIEQKAKQTQLGSDYFVLAKIYRYRGDADSAVDAYNRSMIKNPKDFAVLKEYGLYMAQLGQNTRAEVPLRKAYALRPTDDEVNAALRNIGVIPGPALKDEKALVSPNVPKGPIPPVSEWRMPNLGGENAGAPNDAAQPAGQTVAAPKD